MWDFFFLFHFNSFYFKKDWKKTVPCVQKQTNIKCTIHDICTISDTD